MAYQDLREWLAVVEGIGQLKRMEGVDWDLEMGAIIDVASCLKERAALLFDDIKGHPRGYRVLSESISAPQRLALTTNTSLVSNELELTGMLREKFKALRPIPPVEVKTGPVTENVHTGKDINMYRFPAPRWHDGDGGRYIGTGSVTITRDPEEGWVNLGTYRVMVHDERTLSFHISPGKHGLIHRGKYFARGKPCPVAISFGHDPLLYLLSALFVPYGVSEYDWAGAIKGEPVEVIMGEVTGLPVPANAEIVIEGESFPGESKMEGPFGEYTGYYASGMRSEPFIRVRSVMHRNDPIMCGEPPREGGLEAGTFALRSALIWNDLERVGIPDIRGVACHQRRFITVVSIKQRYPGHAKQAAVVAAQCQSNYVMGRFVIVVDEDIDPSDLDKVLWALATRSDPERSIDIIRRCNSGPLDPAIPKGKVGFSSRAIIDACRPYEWIVDFPAVVQTSPFWRERVKEKWGDTLLR